MLFKSTSIGIRDLTNLKRLLTFLLMLMLILLPVIIWNPVSRGIAQADNQLFLMLIATLLIVGIPCIIIIASLIYAIAKKKYYSLCMS
jgi:hypothetical protein